jgi:hypothetical protein
MKISVSYFYQNNSFYLNNKIFVKDEALAYDNIFPKIIAHTDVNISSTKAQIKISTRHEAQLYYILREKGDELD